MTRRFESLDPDTWRRVDQILDRVFDADETDRESILDEECAGDAELRRQVESLLEAESGEGVLDTDLSDEPSLFAKALGDIEGDLEGDMTVTSSERRFGPYRVVRMLGAGGMGVVYEGWDTRLERPVAIKVLPQGVARSGLADAEERFLREARAASALDHANICSIYDIGVAEEGTLDEGRTYLVMALYRGETLRERIEKGPLPIDEAVDLARQIARGLHRAHEAGIVHRDIKPANVFVTEHGEAKILDFGLAKVIDEAGLTRSGEVLGTPAYMSPEQLLGQPVDARADVWAFGVLLYRMVGGARPFPTQSAASLDAVLSRDPEPLTSHRPETPPELARLVERCLEKDPERRPQSMREILGVLGDTPTATTRWTQVTRTESASSKGRLLWAAAAMVALVLAAVTWRLWDADSTSPRSADSHSTAPQSGDGEATAETEPTGLVVLPFHGLNTDPDVAGLGRVITEMLVTDLRGSPDLAVASSSRLHRALEAVGWSDDEPPSPQTMRRLADEVGHDVVLHGSYTRLGDRYRIFATLERASDEDEADEPVLLSKQVESTEAGLFNAVDELSLAVRDALRARSVEDQGIRAVTTSSLDAMAAYSRSVVLQQEQRNEEAVAELETAVSLDPGFALAWRRLGLIQDNMGRRADAQNSLERAFELSDRLPPKLRVPVRADHYGSQWATLDQAIDAYQSGLDLYPDMTAWRNNLGYTLALVERYDEAEAQFRQSIESGTTFGYAWVNLALALAGQGRAPDGIEVLRQFSDRSPSEWTWRAHLAWLRAVAGDLDGAFDELEAAKSLVAGRQSTLEQFRWQLHVLREEWHEARAVEERLLETSEEIGRLHRARRLLLHGRAEQALAALGDKSSAQDWQALARLDLRIGILLELRRNAEALENAEAMQRRNADGWFELRGIAWAALAEEALGNSDRADDRLRLLTEASRSRFRADRRLGHHVAGRLALARGQTAAALRELAAAVDLLPPRGVRFGMVEPPHVEIWLDLGRAHLMAGDAESARTWLARAADAGSERLSQPVAWTRSLYWLGEAEATRGRPDAAEVRRKRFLTYRGEGDLDRDLVARANDASAR